MGKTEIKLFILLKERWIQQKYEKNEKQPTTKKQIIKIDKKIIIK